LFAPDLRAEEAAPPTPAIPERRMLSFRVAPEWSYRRFIDSEPSSTDKHYAASGIFSLGARVDVFPFDGQPDLGFLASFGHSVGLRSVDIDTTPPTDVGTVFYRYDLGVLYRPFEHGPLAWTLSAAYQRWVFDFDDPAPTPFREVPTARYSFVNAGADARLSVGPLAFLGDAGLLIPLSIASLGDRHPTGGFGARAKLGVAYDLSPKVSLDLSEAYALVSFKLQSVPGRIDALGTVVDHYFATSLGLTVTP
jgi:hypothetical protein